MTVSQKELQPNDAKRGIPYKGTFARRRICDILNSMKTERGENKRTLSKRLAWILSGIVLGVSALVAVVSIARGHETVIDLENYVNVGTDAGGNPAVLLDVDAILNDYRLPNPNRPGVNASDYPEVYALCTARMLLKPIDEEHMRVTIDADTETLARYGITFKATT